MERPQIIETCHLRVAVWNFRESFGIEHLEQVCRFLRRENLTVLCMQNLKLPPKNIWLADDPLWQDYRLVHSVEHRGSQDEGSMGFLVHRRVKVLGIILHSFRMATIRIAIDTERGCKGYSVISVSVPEVHERIFWDILNYVWDETKRVANRVILGMYFPAIVERNALEVLRSGERGIFPLNLINNLGWLPRYEELRVRTGGNGFSLLEFLMSNKALILNFAIENYREVLENHAHSFDSNYSVNFPSALLITTPNVIRDLANVRTERRQFNTVFLKSSFVTQMPVEVNNQIIHLFPPSYEPIV